LAVAKRFGLKYTRYADDITFSSMHNVYQKDSDFLKELHRIIEEQNFHIKESKTRLQKQGYRQEVTGLLVNEKPNVQKRYIKQLRMWLYYWERYGYDKASVYFILQYMENKGEALSGIPRIENVISGKLDYLKMVKGKENSTYLSLKKRFEELLSAEVQLRNQQSTKSSPQINENLASALRGMGLDPTKMITDPNVIADLTEEAYLMFDFQLPEVNENNRGDHLNEVLNTLLSEGLTKAMQQYKTQD
jgi:hypothetical protein